MVGEVITLHNESGYSDLEALADAKSSDVGWNNTSAAPIY